MIEGKYVIVRDDKAGVYAGVVESCEPGRIVWLRNARQLWYWSGANTVLCIARAGASRPDECKFTAPNPELIQLCADSGLVIATTEARASIEAVPVWEA